MNDKSRLRIYEIDVRVTEEEKEMITRASSQLGESMSRFLQQAGVLMAIYTLVAGEEEKGLDK